MKNGKRIFYIDNLRIFLMALVVLHHLSITYGASGGWYYKEAEGDIFTTLILTMFTATNQSFFMGLFFLISAYFTHISLEKKSIGTFVKSRLSRLGIPLLVFYFILSPLTIYTKVRFADNVDISILEFVKQYHGFGFGPLWFVETLIYFSFIYVILKHVFRKRNASPAKSIIFPGKTKIIMFIVAISAVSFIVRIWFQLGTEIPHTGLQLPYFPQYISMLVVGILFAKYRWFEQITFKQGLKWFGFAQLFTLIVFPLLFLFANQDGNPFAGGFTWESAVLCLWEQVVGISLMIGLIGIFKEKLNAQNSVVKQLSSSAYAVFIIHPLVIVSLSIFLQHWAFHPILKFLVVAPLALVLCFGLGILLKKIPVIKKVI